MEVNWQKMPGSEHYPLNNTLERAKIATLVRIKSGIYKEEGLNSFILKSNIHSEKF